MRTYLSVRDIDSILTIGTIQINSLTRRRLKSKVWSVIWGARNTATSASTAAKYTRGNMGSKSTSGNSPHIQLNPSTTQSVGKEISLSTGIIDIIMYY